jgi:transposase
MINIRHILRLYTQNQTMSEIIIQTGIHRSSLKKIIDDFKNSKLSFTEINELSDNDLQELFKHKVETPTDEKLNTLYALFPYIDKELKKKGVTRLLLWEEYKKKHPDGIGRSRFNTHFQRWKAKPVPVMRKEHKAGDKMYIDFAGEKLTITDKSLGAEKKVEVFVAILGASQLTYVEAMLTQRKEDFIPACENALEYYGGVPAAIVPDNLKTAVTKTDRYEPTINETFADFAEHYSTTILPTRTYKPKDKALVEGAVNIIYTRIYAKLRNEKFYCIDDLNKAMRIALEEHNNHILTGKNYSRHEQFEKVEKGALSPLPLQRYEFKKRMLATVGRHGHICLSQDNHYYSVPYQFIGKKVKVMYSKYNVEIFFEYERIALHIRLRHNPYEYTTDKEHLPPTHQFVADLGPERFLVQAEQIHKDVKRFILKILEGKNHHTEFKNRVCQGVLNFAKKVGNDRLTRACQRALDYEIYNYRIIIKILKNGLDKDDGDMTGEKLEMPQHDNIRGSNYYI